MRIINYTRYSIDGIINLAFLIMLILILKSMWLDKPNSLVGYSRKIYILFIFGLITLNVNAQVPASATPPLADPNSLNSTSNRYQISLPGHITWMRNQSLSAKIYCTQINHIDLSGYQIGGSGSRQLDYDGQNFEIQNLSWTPGQFGNHRTSFFSTLNNSALQNMRFTNLQHSTGQEGAGICTFFTNSLMFNVHIISGSIIGEIRTAGFVSKLTNSTIYNCSFNASVKDRCQGIGGLVYELINSSVDQCFVKGTIMNHSDDLCTQGLGVGGIAFKMDGLSSISNSYVHAEINNWTTSTNKVRAGIVASPTIGSIVDNCYFAGQLSGTGALNQPILPTVNPVSTCVYTTTDSASGNSYTWQTSNLINSSGIAYSNMGSASSYPTNWLSDGGWSLDPLVNNGLPYQSGIAQVSSSTLSSLTIPSGQVYEVFPGVVLDVSTLNNSGSIILRSDVSGNYSQLRFQTLGTQSNQIVQSQYLEAGSHLVSSPVSQGFTTTSGSSAQLYSYDASTGNWATIGTNTTTAGLGFAARVDATQIPFLTAAASASVTGTPNTSMTHTLGYASNVAAGGSGSGWNLIGNPYTCGLDWSTITGSLTNVNPAFYVWDPSTSTYKYYSAGGISSPVIAPMQAFWVQATQAGASISTTMAANGTVASTSTHYKTLPDNLVVSVEKVGDSAIADQLWVANIPAASDGFDGAYDAWKMTNGPAMPNVYTWDIGERIAVNATDLSQAKVLPMGFSHANSGTKFHVSLSQVTSGQNYDVYLEDKLTGNYHDLNQSDYAFTHQGWTQEGPRFALHVRLNTVGLDDPDAEPHHLVYQDNDRLMLKSGDDVTAYRIYGINGQEVARGRLTPGMQQISAPTSAGLYIIEFFGSGTSIRQKFHINY